MVDNRYKTFNELELVGLKLVDCWNDVKLLDYDKDDTKSSDITDKCKRLIVRYDELMNELKSK